ncbi:hypothetical protein C5615_36585 [Burkholderia cepacia]|uniref:Uncharacterized protein n=1 Tax=Burkholderia cepacia TaxID=292 RepID=A0A2S8I0V5_BURCE|nr:tetratricopeptide repeat protein [Burkholderia cepacia]PQP08295.1 hypothetical protein C5615_36585 [Burkholderia cepacia]HDR9511850.1 tetratricopeptide repeat protein [Burkholderia cepacia]
MYDPKIVKLANQIGYFLRKKGQFDAALRVFRSLQRMQPDHAYPHMGQALVYAEQGNMDEAKLHLQLVLSRHPNHSLALACLGIAMLLQDSNSNWQDPLSRAADIDDEMGGKSVAQEFLRLMGQGQMKRVNAPVASTARRLGRFS